MCYLCLEDKHTYIIVMSDGSTKEICDDCFKMNKQKFIRKEVKNDYI